MALTKKRHTWQGLGTKPDYNKKISLDKISYLQVYFLLSAGGPGLHVALVLSPSIDIENLLICSGDDTKFN